MTKIFYLTGMHSSGTSLTSNYLQHCGVMMMGKTPIDFLGEDKRFRTISHKILKDSGIHRYDKNVFDHKQLKLSTNTKELMQNQIVSSLTTVRDKHWGWKAPINSLCIWQWVPMLQNSLNGNHEIYTVLIFRHPAEVIKSFYRRKSRKDITFMSSQGGDPFINLENIWSNYYQSVLDFSKVNPIIKLVIIHTWDMMKKPEILTEALGLETINIDGVIDKDRFRSESKLIFRTERATEIWDKLMENRQQ